MSSESTELRSPAPAPALAPPPVIHATPVEPDTREDELLVTKLALKECEENLVQKTQQLAVGEATRRRLLERALSADGTEWPRSCRVCWRIYRVI